MAPETIQNELDRSTRSGELIKNLPNWMMGYNLYVNREKFSLIDHVFNNDAISIHSFADLGGVWNVNAAYTLYTLKKYTIDRAFLVDTNFNTIVDKKVKKYSHLHKITGDFTQDDVIDKLKGVDVIFLFDVLLHQVNPDWNVVLEKYSAVTKCIIIYNQQLINADKTLRLTDLSLEEYKALAPARNDNLYEYIYTHGQDIHPEYQKPWKDIHNFWQWGITDSDLRNQMKNLKFEEIYYKNHGRFSNLPAFENHSFVFVKS